MKKPPAYQMYAADFDMDTAAWTNEEVGAYQRLLNSEWVNGSLPNDLVRLASIVRETPERFAVIWPTIGVKFHENGNGMLYNRRLEQVRTEQEAWREKSRKGGVASGKTRQNPNYKASLLTKFRNVISTHIKINIPPEMQRLLLDDIFVTLGYSFEELILHLENNFKRGMSWSNHGDWHVDHIIPKYNFNLKNIEEFKKCWNINNLQPLWASDNLKKGISSTTEARPKHDRSTTQPRPKHDPTLLLQSSSSSLTTTTKKERPLKGGPLKLLLDTDKEFEKAFHEAREYFPDIGAWFGKSFKQYGGEAIANNRDELLATMQAIAEKKQFDGDPWGYALKTFFGKVRDRDIAGQGTEKARRAVHIRDLYKDFKGRGKDARGETHRDTS